MPISFYKVRPGDQLYQIMRSHYGSASFLGDQAALTRVVLSNNPSIKDINLIYPGQDIMLPAINIAVSSTGSAHQSVVENSRQISGKLAQMEAADLDFMGSIDYLEIFQTGGESFASFVEKSTHAAKDNMRQIALEYYRKEAGTISRNQYNYQRRLNVAKVEQSLGPLNKLVNRGKKPGQVLRVQPHATFRTKAILDEADRMARISKYAKRGGVVLTAFSLGDAAYQVHKAPVNSERTVIVLDTLASVGGAAIGTGLAIAVLGTPVGWIGIAIVVAAGAAGGVIAEQTGKALQDQVLYDVHGNRIDTKADKLWQPFYGPQ